MKRESSPPSASNGRDTDDRARARANRRMARNDSRAIRLVDGRHGTSGNGSAPATRTQRNEIHGAMGGVVLCMSALTLSACGGGGGDSIKPDPVNPPVNNPDPPVRPTPPAQTRLCVNGAAGESNPTACRRGTWTIQGLASIPLDAVKLTNEQMQSRFVIHEGRDRDHALRVRATACNAYVTGCRNAQDWPGKVRYNLVVTKNRTTGTTPFSFIANSDRSSERPYSEEWEYQQFTSLGAKIVSISILLSDRTFSPVEEMGSALPFLVVQGAGNERSDEVGFDGSRSSSSWRNLQAAVGANKALIAAGHAPRGRTARTSGIRPRAGVRE